MGHQATQLLAEASQGSEAAAARLAPLVYDKLRVLARVYLAKAGHVGFQTLQPTALVHEAYLRLVDQKTADLRSRTHFYALAAVALRHVLIDQGRARQRAKRGGDWRRITLSDATAVTGRDEVDLLVLDEALANLAQLDERAARVVELRFFAGMTERDIGHTLGVSERTVRNDWTMARAWLRCELGDENNEERMANSE